MRKIGLILSVLFLSFSCSNENKTEAVFGKIMVAHDEVMPKMRDLRLLKDKITALPDSLKTDEIVQGQKNLQKADDWMMTWMSGFDPSQKEDVEYLNQQLKEVNEMKTYFNKSLKDAEKLFVD